MVGEIKKEHSNKKLEKSDNLKHTKIMYGCAHRFIAQHIHPTAGAMTISSFATTTGIMPIELANDDIGTIHCHGRGGALVGVVDGRWSYVIVVVMVEGVGWWGR